ncbi:winged helix-turn-helix domain-containing protein [Oxobacter pfennigii]|nr:LysR family transcriptional regulator [Oxobacter pfennigii]
MNLFYIIEKKIGLHRCFHNNEVVKLVDKNSTRLSHNKLKSKSKIWIEVDGQVVFGDGRIALFEAIEKLGSIRQAAALLGMSYRAAWGKIKSTEERLGLELIKKYTGGANSGAVLTDDAKELLDIYRQFKKDAINSVDSLFASYFNKFLKNSDNL